MSDKCTWIEWATVIGEPTNNWDTGCGHTFSVTEGKPSENDFKFCCFCGKPLDEHPALLTVIDDEPESNTPNAGLQGCERSEHTLQGVVGASDSSAEKS